MKIPRSFDSFLRASGHFFFRFRNALFPVILVALVLWVRPAQWGDSPSLDRFLSALGVGLVLAGQALRLAVIGYAYIRRGGKDKKVFAEGLVMRGFYAHCRNPMYVGNFLVISGLGLVFGSVWVFAFLVLFFAYVYLAIVSAEEAYLREKFGTLYEEYAQRVNRFVLNPRGLRKSLEEFHYDWRRALTKEYNTLTFTLAILLGLILWKTVSLCGFEAYRLQVLILASLFVPLLVFYVTVRFLKKTRRLRPARYVDIEPQDPQPPETLSSS